MFDPKPELNELAGKPLPPSFEPVITPMGEGDSPLLASQAQVEAARPERASGSPTGCRTSPSCADDLAVIRSCWAERPQPRRRRLPDEHRLDPRRPAVAGQRGSATAWAPRTRTCRASSCCRTTPAHGRQRPAQLGRRLHAGRLPGHAPRRRRRADPEPRAPRRASSDDRQRGKLDFLGRAQPPPRRRRGPSRPSSTPASRATSWPSACRPRPPRRSTSSSETAGDAGPLRHGREGDRRLRPQLPAGPPAGRARRPVRAALPRRRQQVGRPRRASRRTTPSSAGRWTSRSPACSRT